jgi:biopolymer transport protein ExbB
MFSLFVKGGPIMWPLLAASLISMTVVVERLIFAIRKKIAAQPELRKKVLFCVEARDLKQAMAVSEKSQDSVVKMLHAGLKQKECLQTALLSTAADELKKYTRGIGILDTIITLAPLLGLLGTVTGMIGAFGIMGAEELEAPAAITGGIAEALIATGFGLGIAIFSLIPFNWLNNYAEDVKHEMEQSGSALEALMMKLEREEFYANPASVNQA